MEKLSLVTLLLFDIDNFKKYNDEYGHALGDEILRQTAALMKRCCRQQDQVFRIAGDEFAVVFLESEMRQPKEKPAGGTTTRVPASVRAVLERFRRSISSPEFAMLGSGGKGTLTISGGMAIFPHHARTPEELVEAADQALMFFAKKSGKNSIYLVGGDESGE
ncbi:MAG: GGDEF domain-containing protein [Phycisphaerae bacterium]|nr:GGDEF domain-containing protein [Phycisphaerae bacterium]